MHSEALSCLRCKAALKTVTPPELERIEFFACSACSSQYALKPGQELHDRWGMPLTLVLYPLIFARDTTSQLSEVASFVRSKPAEFQRVVLEHIKDELDQPKQKVSQLHGFVSLDERALREFLSALVTELES
jgi:hypothetical protein